MFSVACFLTVHEHSVKRDIDERQKRDAENFPRGKRRMESRLPLPSKAASPPLGHRSQASCYHHRHEVEAWDEEDAEDGRKAHTAHNSDAHAAASRCTGAGRQSERETADDGGEGCHEDRAETELCRFLDGIYRVHPVIDTLLRKFHDEDGILCSQPDDHDDTDLHIDTILVAVTGRAQKSGQLVHDIL